MNISITSESVWQLFLGLGGFGIVWMVLKMVTARLLSWWRQDSLPEQIKKVRERLHGVHRHTVDVDVTPARVTLYWKKHSNGDQVGSGQFDSYSYRGGVRNSAKTKLKIMQDFLRKLDVEAM